MARERGRGFRHDRLLGSVLWKAIEFVWIDSLTEIMARSKSSVT